MTGKPSAISHPPSAHNEIRPSHTDGQTTRATWVRLLAVVFLMALPIRLYVAANAAMISRDGVTFIWYAQRLANGPVDQMRVQDQHPLYPVLVYSAHGAIRVVQKIIPGFLSDPVVSWPVAAMSVTLVGGLLVVVAGYCLAAVLFDRRVAILAALLAALAAEFCQLSADALSDMPHLALYLFSMAAGIYGVERIRYRWLFAAGILSGLAFLTRPEGAEAAVALTGGLLLVGVKLSVRQRVFGALAVIIGAAMIASPYMMVTGKLVQKKSLDRFVGGEHTARVHVGSADPIDMESLRAPPLRRAGATGDVGRAIGRIAEYWCRSLRVTFLVPVVIWLMLRRRLPIASWKGQMVVAAIFLHLLVLILLIVRFDYYRLFSLRHVLILAAMTLPFAAAGLAVVLDQIAKTRRTLLTAAILIVLVGPTLPWMLEARHAEFVGIRRAGEWIRSQSSSAKIMTSRHRSAFYADGKWIRPPEEPSAERFAAKARKHRPDWLVFEERRVLRESPDFFEELDRALKPGETITLAHAEPGDGEPGRRVLVYAFDRIN